MRHASDLHDTAGLRVIETRAAAMLGDSFELMRRAGQAAWRELLQHWPQAQRIVVICGPGNNGGDGYVLARHALASGRAVQVVHPDGHAPRGDVAARAHAEYQQAGGTTQAFGDALPPADLIVDALFGIGLSRAPDAAASALIDAVNAQEAPVFALDVPSGVDADRGSAPGIAVRATRTLEFIARKPGLCTGVARDYVGAGSLASLDLPAEVFAGIAPNAELLVAHDLPLWLHPRARDTHKGANGRVLCVGGDHGSGGAIVLSAEAALRSGAGLVDVATREAHVPALLARLPEAMAHSPRDDVALRDLLERATTVAIGPGLGQGEWGHVLFMQAVASGKALVIDADALNLLAAAPMALPQEAILTPHPGEAARLLGVTTAEVQRDRFAAARELCARHQCVVVLKGAGTIVAGPDATPRVVAAGNPGMAVGGMGDVLTGVIAALRAQGLRAFDAASCGALLHAAAGDAAVCDGGERGLLPTDLMPWLRRLANPGAIA
ncbi:MAG TPA: NAD(P)H-hydrate dehydratase [Lysobacter sp.]